jgi:hypothetical protein
VAIVNGQRRCQPTTATARRLQVFRNQFPGKCRRR